MHQSEFSISGRCIWMDAGVLTYKLCDRAFGCEECPLDMVLRRSDEHPMRERSAPRLRVRCPLPEGVDDASARLLDPLMHVDLPEDVLYSPQHVWVRTLASRAVLLGIDPALATLLPMNSRLVLSSGRAALERGKAFAWIYHGSRVLPLLSPLTGTILRQNAAAEHSISVGADAWMLAMLPSRMNEEAEDLAPARESAAQHEQLLSRFVLRASRHLAVDATAVLNDGGEIVPSIEAALGESAYFDLIHSVFTNR